MNYCGFIYREDNSGDILLTATDSDYSSERGGWKKAEYDINTVSIHTLQQEQVCVCLTL